MSGCIFPLFGDVTIDNEELQMLTYARYFWRFNSDGSLVCHTYVTRSIRL